MFLASAPGRLTQPRWWRADALRVGLIVGLGLLSGACATAVTLAEQIYEIEAVFGNEPPEVVARLKPLEAAARAEGGTGLRVFLAAWGYAHGAMDKITVADAATAELIELGERSGDAGAQAAASTLRANMLKFSGRLRAAYDWVSAAVPLADKAGDESLRYWVLMSAGDVAVQTGRLQEGLRAFEAAELSAQAQGNARRRAQSHIALAPLRLVLGETQQALQDALHAYQLGEESHTPSLQVAAKVIESLIAVEARQADAAERALVEARKLASQVDFGAPGQREAINPASGGPRWYSSQGEVVQQLCDLYLSVRNFAAARRYGERALGLAQKDGDPDAVDLAKLSLGMALTGEGSVGPGRKFIDAGLASMEQRGQKVRLLEQLNRHAELLEVIGDAAGALRQSRKALALEAELVRSDRLNTVLELQRRSSFEQHERALDGLRHENDMQASALARHESERRLTLGLLAALLAVALLTVALYRRARLANLALQRHNAELAYVSTHDRVTGLPNRRSIERDSAQLTGGSFTGLGIHIDRLGLILGSLGHTLGDQLICQIAGRLRPLIEQRGGTLYRLDGLSFGALLPGAEQGLVLAALLDELLAAMPPVFVIEHQELTVTLSIGAATYPEHGAGTLEVGKAGQLALRAAQAQPGNSAVVFTEALARDQQDRLRLQGLLAQALGKEELALHYQPQCRLEGRALTGFEALLRWHSPEGLIPPDRFIPLAEESGLMVPIGRWVLQAACRQAKAWQDMGHADLVMAINVSPRQFQHPDFMLSVREALTLSGVDPACIELEITEGVLMDGVDGIVGRMADLKQLGLKLAIDDFGTGYSSLAYLKRFPLDRLKIDRSFVRDLTDRGEGAAIVRALIQLAHGLGMAVVAEGVEDEAQESCLREWGCELMQGYGYARPMPATQATSWIQSCSTDPCAATG